MASRTNKYASLNFNDIYEKKIITPSNNNRSHASSSSPSFSSSFSGTAKTSLSNSRIHGNMLVLSRPTPKPIVPQSPPSQTPPPPLPLEPSFQDPIRSESDFISLRPLGSTGSGSSLLASPPPPPPILSSQKPDKDLTLPLSPSPKTNRFIPPHLRPGFVGREEKPEPDFHQKQTTGRTREIGSQRLGHYGEDGRLNSGLMEMKRPGSGGTRPNSSG